MPNSLKLLRYLQAAAVLRGEEILIGRSDYSSILIAHPSVSRLHATITQRESQCFIHDLGSRNGTYVNGERIGETPVPIGIGDAIRIGKVDCVIESAADNSRITTEDCPSLADATEPELQANAQVDEDQGIDDEIQCSVQGSGRVSERRGDLGNQ